MYLNCTVCWARICKPFKEPRNWFPAWRACATTPFCRTGPRRLHRLAKLIPRNRFLGSLNVYKYGLWTWKYYVACAPPQRKLCFWTFWLLWFERMPGLWCARGSRYQSGRPFALMYIYRLTKTSLFLSSFPLSLALLLTFSTSLFFSLFAPILPYISWLIFC